MPQKRAAYKEMRKAKKRHKRNISVVSQIKTLIKKFNLLLSANKLTEAKDFLKTVSSTLDKARKKGIIHRNVVSRKISRLSKKLSHAANSKR